MELSITNEPTSQAKDAGKYIGGRVTVSVAYKRHEEYFELVVTGVLAGVVDIYMNDGRDVKVSTWHFRDGLGTVSVNWDDLTVSGKSVTEIVAVEYTVHE